MRSHTYAKSFLLLTTLALCSLSPPANASPLPPPLPYLEQELDSLVPPPPPQDIPEDTPHPPPSSQRYEEALQDVLRDDQDVSEKGESSPERSPSLQDRSGTEENDAPADTDIGDFPDRAASDHELPFQTAAESSEVEIPSPRLEEADANGEGQEEELLVLGALKGHGEETQPRRLSPAGMLGREIEAVDLQDASPPDVIEQDENEAAARELDSISRLGAKERFRVDQAFDGYDSDDDDDDDDDVDANSWMKVDDDESRDKSYTEDSFPTSEASSIAESRESSDPWRLDDWETPRDDLDDVMGDLEDVGEVVQEEEKRGRSMGEEARFRPVRVIELNETLYLNTTKDDHLPKFQPVPMPDKFEDYDVNRDGMISLPELRYVSRATEGAAQAFRDADSDGDGWVDRGEFRRAGWGLPVDSAPPPSPQA